VGAGNRLTPELANSTSWRTVETDMPAEQQRISPGFPFFVIERDVENPTGPEILAETGRKERFSLDSLYLQDMSRLRGGGRSRVRTLLRPQFPANREKYREFRPFGTPSPSQVAVWEDISNKNGLPIRIGTGTDQGRNR
jgi:hypothetical protein